MNSRKTGYFLTSDRSGTFSIDTISGLTRLINVMKRYIGYHRRRASFLPSFLRFREEYGWQGAQPTKTLTVAPPNKR